MDEIHWLVRLTVLMSLECLLQSEVLMKLFHLIDWQYTMTEGHKSRGPVTVCLVERQANSWQQSGGVECGFLCVSTAIYQSGCAVAAWYDGDGGLEEAVNSVWTTCATVLQAIVQTV
jgi:hypothetical protein